MRANNDPVGNHANPPPAEPPPNGGDDHELEGLPDGGGGYGYSRSSNADGSRAVDAVGFGTYELGGLSPELLLGYLQNNLEGFDEQIGTILGDMRERRAKMAEIGSWLRELRALQARARDAGEDDINVDEDSPLGLGSPADPGAPGGETVRQALARMGFSEAEVTEMIDRDDDISADDFTALIENLDSQLSELNDASEYQSTLLQSIMSKRSQLVQLTSNMMRELNETAMSVIKNV